MPGRSPASRWRWSALRPERPEDASLPLLWIGTSEIFREAGFPYALGLARDFGIAPEALLFSEAPKLADALWIAEEAARLTALAAVVLEMRGNPAQARPHGDAPAASPRPARPGGRFS